MSHELVDAQVIAENLAAVYTRMAAAARRAQRSPDSIALVAVSKNHPFAAITAAYTAGQRDFGENRVEELWPKVEEAKAQGLDEIRWHLIGTIQSRKSQAAVGPFALIHAVDRLKLAGRLSRDAEAAGVVLQVLLEVNVSAEASKHGFTPDEALAEFDQLRHLAGLQIQGLMTIAPYEVDAELTRPVFRTLRELRDEIVALYPQINLPHLSMGMTNDFEIAIEEGASLVRIGSAIFGVRNYGAGAD